MNCPKKCIISQDSYYKENNNLSFDERALINFDHPRAIDFDLLVAHLKELKAEKQFTNLFILCNTQNRRYHYNTPKKSNDC
jgi:uridine kinase